MTPVAADVRDTCQRIIQQHLGACADIASQLRTGDTLARRKAYLNILAHVCGKYPMDNLNWYEAQARRQEISEVVEQLCKQAGPGGGEPSMQ